MWSGRGAVPSIGGVRRHRYAHAMLLERLLDNLAVHVEPFARCDVAAGCCLRLHDLGWVTLHFVLQGEGTLTGGSSTSHHLGPGTLAVIPAHMPHTIRQGDGARVTSTDPLADRDAAGLLRYVAAPGDQRTRSDDGETTPPSVDPDTLVIACGEMQALYAQGLGLFDRLTEPVVVDLSSSDGMMITFARLLEESERPSAGSRAMLEALMNACLVQLFRRLCDGPECALPWLDALQDERMAAVLDRLLEHPEHDHSLESLAETAAMSRSAFAETFHTCFGRTPMAFLRELRLRRGAELLRTTELTVDRIAHRVGFASRSHFSRAFTDQFGHSPTMFRSRGASSLSSP
jgi:AraC family transcriptional regulator, activator of mtrCDE